MGAIEDKYFHRPAGEITLLPPINIELARTALIVIDMQYHDAHPEQGVVAALEKLYPGSTAYYAERLGMVVPAIGRLLDHARATGLEVIHVVVGSSHRDLRDFNKRMRSWESSTWRNAPAWPNFYWTESPTYRIPRGTNAGRRRDRVPEAELTAPSTAPTSRTCCARWGIDTLLVTGCVTNYCVETTVRDAADRGFACALIDEAVAGFSQESHDATLGFAARRLRRRHPDGRGHGGDAGRDRRARRTARRRRVGGRMGKFYEPDLGSRSGRPLCPRRRGQAHPARLLARHERPLARARHDAGCRCRAQQRPQARSPRGYRPCSRDRPGPAFRRSCRRNDGRRGPRSP